MPELGDLRAMLLGRYLTDMNDALTDVRRLPSGQNQHR